MAELTPMMRQYMEVKQQYADCFLFYRLGDFYEMFFDDAVEGAKILELTLTGRDCGLDERAPMCGVPYHSVDTYINKLIGAGHKVAICEQVEDPSLAKGLVQRAVTRVITPGTVIEEQMLSGDQNNFIVGILYAGNGIGFSYADVSTGAFFTFELYGDNAIVSLMDELVRLQPTEVVVNEALAEQEYFYKWLRSNFYLEKLPNVRFHVEQATERLQTHFHVASLSGFGITGKRLAVGAAGALLYYLSDTQKNALTHIHALKLLNRSAYMQLDIATRRNLELTQPLRSGANKSTLLYLLNSTQTRMGARLLREWIDCPLQQKEEIRARQDAVEALHRDLRTRRTLRAYLGDVYDVERLTSKIAYGTIHPKDCLALSQSLRQIVPITMLLYGIPATEIQTITEQLDPMDDVIALIDNAISPDASASMKDGGYIRSGYSAEIDELRTITRDSKALLEELATREREETGIKTLKIGYNRVFGYYIEVTKSFMAMVPYRYERKQTLANAERYITAELKELEQKILGAADRLLLLESTLYAEIKEALLGCTERLQQDASLLSKLDVYQSLAEVAVSNRYVRPEIMDEPILEIENGRHPIVEQLRKEAFIPNDVHMDNEKERLLIVTGPNMAGKSTYMRQVALITLMAHVGSFVPADKARIGIVDRIFTRIGASDDLSAGESTFMVEMTEMANIVHHATQNSLLILDEIGRGTSTYDGLSIAWAVLEYIANPTLCGAKTLFATHYHELSELEGKLDGVVNYRINVKEIGDEILFLRKIVRGSADKSFGIHVAKLAGLPDSILSRAKEILSEIEEGGHEPKERETKAKRTAISPVQESILRDLNGLDLDRMTPVEAFMKLHSYVDALKG